MIQGLIGAGCMALVLLVVVVTFPVWWLLSGGDLELRHWALDGDGTLLQRWKHRDTNGKWR